jgi:hypothetical protein
LTNFGKCAIRYVDPEENSLSLGSFCLGQIAPFMINHVGRKIFENEKARTAFGVILILAAVCTGMIQSPTLAFNNKKTAAGEIKELTASPSPVMTCPTQLRLPVDKGYLSQGYSFYHPAIDIAADFGSPVYPVTKGKVEKVGFDFNGLGRIIIVDHGSGFKSLYAHLKDMKVKQGQEVSIETIMGHVGLTGRTSGPHLHLEFHVNGEFINPQNILERA